MGPLPPSAPYGRYGFDCTADITLMVVLICVGYISVIQVKYLMAISKMDGAGFVPPFQEQITKHLVRVDQRHRDEFNETEVRCILPHPNRRRPWPDDPALMASRRSRSLMRAARLRSRVWTADHGHREGRADPQ